MSEVVTLPIASAAETQRDLWRRAKKHSGLVTVCVIVLLLATLAVLAVPLLLGAVVDVVVGERPRSTLSWLIGGLVVATLLQGLLYGVGSWAVGRLGELVLAEVREDVVERALAVPIDQVEEAGTGELVARACSDVDAVSEALRQAVPEIIAPALIITFTIAGLATIDWRLALAGIAATPIQVFAARWYLRRSRPVYTAERAAEGRRSQRLGASVTGARTVRALRLSGPHLAHIEATSQEATDLAVTTSSIRARFYSMLNCAEFVGLALVLVVSYPLVQNDIVTLGGATAAALYFYRLFDPVGALLSELDTTQAATAALARLVGVASMPDPSDGVVPDADGTSREGDHAVQLAGVSFAYGNGVPVLHGVDLRIAPGERVALVGPSGAGKTTVAKLVSGIHGPTAGTVLVDGRPADGSTGDGRVTLVSQEVHVFSGTVADDLRLARPDATDDELCAVLERVGALGWVQALPEGLATVVGEGGHRLSATQAQQLALARLVLADPPVAVLDEATAEAGSAGAAVLEDAAAAAIAGRTSIVIAHRLTQAVAADRVVVMEDGRIVEEGTHADLLESDGLYADLWAAWSGARTLAD